MLGENRTRRLALVCLTATLGRFVFLRWLCLSSARLYRRFVSWTWSGWRKLLVVYLTAAALIAIKRIVTDPNPATLWHALLAHPKTSPLAAARWFFLGGIGPWVEAVGLAALIFACAEAWRARKRIVIVAFANATGEERRGAMVDGLPRRLMTELGEIADIHRDVSDDPVDLSLGEPMRLPLAVDGATAFSDLKASMKDQKVQVGPLSIPLGGAVSTLSTLVRGPQIRGSVQETSKGLIMEASIAGGGYDQTWRVTADDIEAELGGVKPADEVART